MLLDLRIQAVDTVRLCRRTFPQIVTIYLLGWLASHLTLKIAVVVGDISAWAALAVFAFSFLFTLVAIVLILRVCGRELGIWDLIPPEEAVADNRDSSLTQMVAVTLLPFLGLYAAFGQVNAAADTLTTEQIFRNSIFLESVLSVVRNLGITHPWRMFAILAAIYLLRRGVDAAHERTGLRALGLAVALLESIFILVVIFGGSAVFRRVTIWFGQRAFIGWLDRFGDAVRHLLSLIDVQLPAAVARIAGYLTAEIWPVLWPVISQPIIWLAVAALVFGSQVLSLAELWRRGRPIAGRVPGASVFARHTDKIALRRIGPPPAGVRRIGAELKDAFLGDLDDKYLPTFHSIRLVIRAGAVFLGAYVLLYTAILVIQNSLSRLIHVLIGGREVSFWFVADPFIDLVKNVPLELLRLCLLAVAFRRCLEVFQDRGRQLSPVPSEVGAEPLAPGSSVASGAPA